MKVTYGHNKDGRPDLKQIVIGLGVTPQRLPIAAKVENGNLDDKTWNHAFIQRLRGLLSEEEWNGLTYVADSVLATKDNLDLMMSTPRLSFITQLPDTFELSRELKEEALWKMEWENVGPFGWAKPCIACNPLSDGYTDTICGLSSCTRISLKRCKWKRYDVR